MAGGSGWGGQYNKSAKSRRARYQRQAGDYVLNRSRRFSRGRRYRQTEALPF